MKTLLTNVITLIVNDRLKLDNSFGVSIVNLPDIDFKAFVEGLSGDKKLDILFRLLP